MAKKTGSETMGAAGEKSRMTLFKDDRSEDLGAILFATLVISIVIVLTAGKSGETPANPASGTTTTSAPASK